MTAISRTDDPSHIGRCPYGDIRGVLQPSVHQKSGTIACGIGGATTPGKKEFGLSAQLISSSKNIAQFLDRDTRPDFASTVMIPALQDFIKNPNDVSGLLKKIEDQKKTIFTS